MGLLEEVFEVLDWRSLMGKPLSAWMLTMAAVLARLLSMVIFSGTPEDPWPVRGTARRRHVTARPEQEVHSVAIPIDRAVQVLHWPPTLT